MTHSKPVGIGNVPQKQPLTLKTSLVPPPSSSEQLYLYHLGIVAPQTSPSQSRNSSP
ncbi:hypothetical protein TSUD_175950 [Trifolium subterraneum]|uniref:Uncharacterized protein n=1 Tax=Trifolium subterraneum TaxID=3900 RepID=A0A2Z6M7V8_TRISU|nr:hypothetical protein TSUD_175950 [Trifolium subterraneum]